eukprot:TRINITY_DN50124_c0_g1_i1.p1 TRINITY_DN50124_c0_g1~~TRINITY_DN50124_c0_g1_i1.p1  ORF type:complete len:330 (+),score=98.21 TRINITY_DN50124_c0_g1_i1:106-1095(+)
MNDALMVLFALIGLALLCGWVGIYKINEGHVGVRWRAGALIESLQDPGLHWKLPILDKHAEVLVQMQTDSVQNIACGTSGGVMVYFDRIEVVNRLDRASVLDTMRKYGEHYDKIWIFDKIHHEVNQFCSKHTLQEVYIDKFDQLDERLQEALQKSCSDYETGIDISAVRVTKPRIPDEILRNYVTIESEKTKLRIAQQRQEVVLAEAETESQKQKLEAMRAKAVKEISMDQRIMEETKLAEMEVIKSETESKKSKVKADAEAYSIEKMAEANKLLLTKEYLTELLYKAIANNSKIYFGDSIPKMFADPAATMGLASGRSSTEGTCEIGK